MASRGPFGAALLGAVLLLACGDADKPRSPEGAVRALIAAARAGDRGAVYRRMGPATRAQIAALEEQARRGAGRAPLRPEDFLSVGWAPPSWEPAGVRTLRRDGTTADVEVSSAAGDRHTLSLVREGEEWKIELPSR